MKYDRSENNNKSCKKNNLVVIQLGNIRGHKQVKTKTHFRKNPQAGRVYSKDGICPTLNTMSGGHRQPYIIVKETTKRVKL